MALEWVTVPFSGQYSNVFRVMIGFHGVHALVIGLILWRVYHGGQAGQYDATHYWPVEGGAGLWYFVTIAWLLFFVVLYVI
jgi:heme/copper-type cytochrome/quinol oxidase subunit 3